MRWIGIIFAASLCSAAMAQTAQPQAQLVDVDLASGTTVTLKLASVEAVEAAAELSEKAGSPGSIQFREPSGESAPAIPKVTLELNNEPLLAGVAKLCIEAKANLSQTATRESILMLQAVGKPQNDKASSQLSAPASYSGPFAVFAASVGSSQGLPVIEAERGERRRQVSLNFSLIGEPKIMITAISPYAELEEVSDEQGTNYVPQDRQREGSWNPHHQGPQYPFSASVNDVPTTLTKLVSVKGNLRVRMVKKYYLWTISLSDQAQQLSAEEMSYTISPPENPSPQRTRLRVTIPRGQRDEAAWEVDREMMLASRFAAYDAQGKLLEQQSRNIERSGESLIIALGMLRSKDVGAPTKLVWQAPLEVEEVAVPFEFKDLPVPY